MSTTCPPLRFVERTPRSLDGDSSFWVLYGESFSPRRREPPRTLVEGVRSGKVVALVAEDDDQTVALAVVHLLERPAVGLLTYLAVTPELQGQRVGGTVLQQVVALAAERQRRRGREPRGWAAEVPLPELAPTQAERERRRRLLLFFRRHGARPLPCSYLLPPLRGGTPTAARLLHAPDGGMPLRRNEVAALLRAIYFEKYGATNGVDERLLASLLAPVPVGAPSGCLPYPARPFVPPGPDPRG